MANWPSSARLVAPGERKEETVAPRTPQLGVWHGLRRLWEGLKRSHDVLWNQQIAPLRPYRGFESWALRMGTGWE